MTEKHIIYEDDEIVVIERYINNDRLIMTFGDAVNLANGDNFYAEKPIIKHNISAISFMSKTKNWFPEKNMISAIQVILSKLKQFKVRICYGGSMGGYGALKYSKLLMADYVISFIPQWSINASEIIDPSYNHYYLDQKNSNMAIKFSDLAGKIYIVIDPDYKADMMHLDKIKKLNYPIEVINCMSSDHHVTSILAGSEFFIKIVNFVTGYDTTINIKKSIRHIRKNHDMVNSIIINRAMKKHPKMLFNILKKLSPEAEIFNKKSFLKDIENFFLINFYLFDKFEIFDQLQKLKLINRFFIRLSAFNCFDGNHLRDFRGKQLVYNCLNNKLELREVERVNKLSFLIPISINNDLELLSINIDNKNFPIVLNQNNDLFIPIDDFNNLNFVHKFLVCFKKQDYYVITSNQFYMTALPNGQCTFRTINILAWEQFYPFV